MNELRITIKDIDDLKNHLAESISRDVQMKIDPLVAKMEAIIQKVGIVEGTQVQQGAEIKSLKANQAKALVGWTILVTGVTLLLGQGKAWLTRHIHFGG